MHHPTGLAVGLRLRSCANGPMTWFLEAERGMEGPPSDKLYQEPSFHIYSCVCQCPEGGGKRACLSKKIVPFEDSFEGIESLVLTETCCFTLNDNGTEAMGN